MATLRRNVRLASGEQLMIVNSLTIPTTQPGPTPLNVWQNPTAWGWPGASNTGPTKAMVASGGIDSSANGDVIDAKNVSGGITIRGDNCIIRNCRAIKPVSSGQYTIRLYGTNLLIEDSEIVGGSISVYSTGGGYTVRRCEIYGCGDGPRIEQDNTVVEHSWIHDLFRTTGSHNDCIQIRRGANCRVHHNTLRADKGSDFMNGTIQWGSPISGTYDNFRVTDNLLSGGNYTLMGPDPIATRQVFTGNRFSRISQYGPVKDGMPADAVWSANVWDDTNVALPRP